ncbi:MAG: type II toxin-antitoxin system VapC family toxin [Terracidiphilus sp.]
MVIFDSSIFVDDFRSGMHAERIAGVEDLVRASAVVLAELWRGAISKAEQALLRDLESKLPILTPTEKNWLESGQILMRIQKDRGFERHKLRDLHFDVLIALTARAHGARVITSNREDFELIRDYRDFKLEVW